MRQSNLISLNTSSQYCFSLRLNLCDSLKRIILLPGIAGVCFVLGMRAINRKIKLEEQNALDE